MGGKRWRQALPPAAALLLTLALWEAACAIWRPEPWMLPAPSTIAGTLWSDAGLLFPAAGYTLRLVFLGMGLGVALGAAVALLFHLVPWLRAAFAPLLVISQNIPIVALGPLLIVWFGFGMLPKLYLIILVSFFPVVMSTLTGLRQAEPHLREYLAMIGASRAALLRRLELPASLPHFFTGLKITATYAVSTAVVAEWLGADRGIGKYMMLKKSSYDAAGVFASVLWVVALSLAVYGLAVLLERLVVRWTPSRERESGERGGGARWFGWR